MGLLAWLDDYDRRTFRRAAEHKEERRQRWNQHGAVWWLAMSHIPLLVILVVMLVPAVLNDRNDRDVGASLDRDGIVADATAVGFRFRVKGGSLFFGESVQVAFTTMDGQPVKTWVPYGKDLLAERGDHLSVRYLRGDPSVARLLSDPTPRKGRWMIVLAVYAATILITVPMVIVLRWRSLNRA